MPICSKCKIEKERVEFYNSFTEKNGLQSRCKLCSKKYGISTPPTPEQQKRVFRSNKGYKIRMYFGMKTRIKHNLRYKDFTVDFSLEDFYKFVDTTNFEELRLEWEKAGYKKTLSPSVDRIDNEKGYTLDNIQFITQVQNSKKRKFDNAKRLLDLKK